MKTPGQLAFEAYQQAMASGTLHKLDTSAVHIQPWDALDGRQQRAWELAAQAAKKEK
jgi:hypothetical protein